MHNTKQKWKKWHGKEAKAITEQKTKSLLLCVYNTAPHYVCRIVLSYMCDTVLYYMCPTLHQYVCHTVVQYMFPKVLQYMCPIWLQYVLSYTTTLCVSYRELHWVNLTYPTICVTKSNTIFVYYSRPGKSGDWRDCRSRNFFLLTLRKFGGRNHHKSKRNYLYH